MTRVLVLGGYGLIGWACMRALQDDGLKVVGMGRSRQRAMRCDPDASWIIRDITSIETQEWVQILADFDVVVNASGALQDGARDSLQAIHVRAVQSLVLASAQSEVRIVQISAAGVSLDSSTAFFRTKAQGDAIIQDQAADWVILRPTLVLSSEAYGGTALLRAAAALPVIRPVIFPDAQVQTVHIDDVADAVVRAAKGEVASGTIADLTEPGSHSFPDLVAKVRRWQGWDRATPLNIPNWAIKLTGKCADMLGHLGWRSPLRTSALLALEDGIRGDASGWPYPCRSLNASLAQIPATRQERLFARAYLMVPLAIGTLSVFWVFSGLIGLIETESAQKTLTDRGTSPLFAVVSVGGGIVADLILGLAVLWRRLARPAALGMVGLSFAYLIGAAVMTPDLWLDPLGPMVKVFPGITLALFVWMMVEDE